jgi:hypothetical protein
MSEQPRWTVRRWHVKGDDPRSERLPNDVTRWDLTLTDGANDDDVFVTHPDWSQSFHGLMLGKYPVYAHDDVPTGHIFRTNEAGWQYWRDQIDHPRRQA